MYEYATKEIYLIILLVFVNFMLLWNKFDTLLNKYNLGSKNFYALRFVSFCVAILLASKLFDLALNKRSYFYMTIESIKTQTKHYPRKSYGPFADILFTLQDIYIEPLIGSRDSNLIIDKALQDNRQIIVERSEMPDIYCDT